VPARLVIVGSLLLSLVGLLGLYGVGSHSINAVAALLWGVGGTVVAVVEARRTPEYTNRAFAAMLALIVGLAACGAALLVLVTTAPCGSSCL
jgi:hypothetical protein